MSNTETSTAALAPSYTHRMSFRRPGPTAWLHVEQAATLATVRLNGRVVGTHLGAWSPFEFDLTPLLRDENELEIVCEDRLHGTDGFLPVLGVRWTGLRGAAINTGPSKPTVASGQRSAVDGTRLLVDGRPFRVRGILHWGYYPCAGPAPQAGRGPVSERSIPDIGAFCKKDRSETGPPDCKDQSKSNRTSTVPTTPVIQPDVAGYHMLSDAKLPPWPGDEQIRREITELQSFGFNLIKFCLWAPPTRYLDLCDELGMLVWQEYPVWAGPLRDDSLLGEFRELLERDRPYPCVVLRTFTCENDHVAPEISRRLVDLAHELVPGCLAADNSGWLCNEHAGDFHDEHPYVHNALWPYYARRMRDKLTKPLLLGETMVADTLDAERVSDDAELTRSYAGALAMRRFQIETLARELPDVGYVICGLRDTEKTPLGLYTHAGRAKYTPADWAWHGASWEASQKSRVRSPGELGGGSDLGNRSETPPSLAIPISSGAPPLIGPRKGQWKCSEVAWWSPHVRVHDQSLPVELIQREAAFELLSGRVLTHTEGARVLVELVDVHPNPARLHPLVVEFRSAGKWHIVSALRHDTPAGRAVWEALVERERRGCVEPPPEIGPISGTSIVLEDWEMWLDSGSSSILRDPGPLDLANVAGPWRRVKCDTPLVNGGVTLFEGWAIFRTRFDYPGGPRTLHCESVADYFELYIDGTKIGEAGPRHGTWDGTRDVPRDFGVDLAAGSHEIVFRVRDWRAAGGMVGPVYFASDLTERIL